MTEAKEVQPNTNYLARRLEEIIRDCVAGVTGPAASSASREVQQELEWRVRFWLQTQLVPVVMAVTSGLFGIRPDNAKLANSNVIKEVIPQLLNQLGDAPLAVDAQFLESVSRDLDPEKYAVLSENLGPGLKRLSVESFSLTLASIFAD